ANSPYRFGAGRNAGLLAQDVEKVFPEMVAVDAHGYKTVNYSELPYLTLVAIRELKTENDSLRAQLAEMEARLARLEKPHSRAKRKMRSRTNGKPQSAAAGKLRSSRSCCAEKLVQR
ncbi:MAG: hypothetical protein ACHP7P_08975, partial [Terriglobales bacterium]